MKIFRNVRPTDKTDQGPVLILQRNKKIFDSDSPMFIFLRKQLEISQFRKAKFNGNGNVTN